jgi:hypothetical protein
MLASDQASPLKRGDMFCDCRSRFDSEVSCYLGVGWFVAVSLKKASDVVENLFLSLRAWEHQFGLSPFDDPACKKNEKRQRGILGRMKIDVKRLLI